MFTTIIVQTNFQPVGSDLCPIARAIISVSALIIFTIIIRLLLWPLVKTPAPPDQSHACPAAGDETYQKRSQRCNRTKESANAHGTV
jgi:hypothetical protein